MLNNHEYLVEILFIYIIKSRTKLIIKINLKLFKYIQKHLLIYII